MRFLGMMETKRDCNEEKNERQRPNTEERNQLGIGSYTSREPLERREKRKKTKNAGSHLANTLDQLNERMKGVYVVRLIHFDIHNIHLHDI